MKNIIVLSTLSVLSTTLLQAAPIPLPRPQHPTSPVLEWNTYLEQAVFATAEPVPSQGRSAAIVHLAIFDAVNGIQRRYTPYHVTEMAPHGARIEAAAIQAAYTALVALYPTQAEMLQQCLTSSLYRLPGRDRPNPSVARGRAWGEHVAKQILQLRAGDHWNDPQPAYMGGFDIGQWRSLPAGTSPDGTLGAVFPQLAVMTPFGMTSPDQFRPGPPYGSTIPLCLQSSAYAADLEEVKLWGRVDSPVRTAEQTSIARLWQAMGAIDENRAVRSVIPRQMHIVDQARIFALANMAAHDGLIIGWDSKFEYELWRPHHAIRLADTDGNPDTEADPDWTGLILAPRFPEYVSNHSALTSGFMRVVARELGDEHSFELSSPNFPGFVQHYQRFSDAAAQVKEARIWGGIHFRNACNLGAQLGLELGDFIVDTYLTPLED